MQLLDVNVLVYAYRDDAHRHGEYRIWMHELLNADEPFGICDIVLSGFVRVVTHPKVFAIPSPVANAIEFVDTLRSAESATVLAPGSRHWEIFVRLCRQANAKGNLVPDAYLAALAVETGSVWITTDGDYKRFPGLKSRHPLGD